MKAFLTDALTSALDLGIATPEDVLRHVTPDVLAESLPRPLWARLLTACVGASVVDATLVIETIGVPNLCEHVSQGVLWSCLEEVARRTLGMPVLASPPAPVVDWSRPGTPPPLAPPPSVNASSNATTVVAPPPTAPPQALIIAAPPPPTEHAPEPPPARERRSAFVPSPTPIPPPAAPAPAGANPLADIVAELEAEQDRQPTPRPRSATQSRMRASNTGIGNRTPTPNTTRRPQASATPISAVLEAGTSRTRRGQTEINDYDIETDVRPAEEFRSATTEELVDWPAEETVTGGDDYTRKR